MKLMESNLRQKKNKNKNTQNTSEKKKKTLIFNYVTTHMSFWWREDKKGLQLFFNTY